MYPTSAVSNYPNYAPLVLQSVPKVEKRDVKVFVYELARLPNTLEGLNKFQPTKIHRLVSKERFSLSSLYRWLAERRVPVPSRNGPHVDVYFRDEDDDLVTLISEEDWSLAWELNKKIKVHVVAVAPKKESVQFENPFLRGVKENKVRGCPFAVVSNRQPQRQHQALDGLLDGVLLNLFNGEVAEQKKTEKKQHPEREPKHYGIHCDGCDKSNFAGKRFKCNQCPDFDFCEDCHQKSAAQHANGAHSFRQVPARSCGFLANLFQQEEASKKDETSVPQQTVNTPVPIQPTVQVPEVVAEEAKTELPVEQFVVPSENDYPIIESYKEPETVEENPHEIKIESEPVSSKYQDRLKLLLDMGFSNEQQCIELLNKHEGDVQRCVLDILNASYY